MRGLATLTAAAALAVALGLAGTAKAEVFFPFDTDLVAYWPFDDDTAADQAPAGSVADNGTFIDNATTSTTVPPVVPNAKSLDLDGAGDRVEVTDSADLDQAGDFTIAAWVALDVNKSNNAIVMKEPDNTERNYGFIISGNNLFLAVTFDNTVVFGAGSGDCDVPRDTCWVQGASDFVDGSNPLGTWRHIVGVYTNSTKTLKAYVDGVLDGTATITTIGIPKLNTQDVWIGARPPFTPDDDVDGLIDEVRIYDVALTAGEIATLHSSVAVFKELVSATENSPSNSDGDLQTNEDWEFVMRVTVANNTSDDVTNATVRDPLPGDLELGDLTSGTVAACEENDTTTGAGDDFDGITVSPSIGTVTILERGKTDKCIIDWSIPDGELDAGEFVTLTITASTDVNPRGIRTGDPEEFQEYTTAATNCINQGAKLTGTLDSTPVIIQSNGLEVTDGDELPDDVAFVKHDDCG